MMNNSSFAWKEMLAQGWPVLSVLLICSILSFAVAWERWKSIRRGVKGMPKVLEAIAERIRHAIHADEKERIARHEISKWVAPLEERLSVLGTIASTSPFIGLLGTVLGIIKAFRAVASSMGGGPSVVANGISEALITTAAGLAVAIPAVVFYNYFNSKLQAYEHQLEIAAGDLIYGNRK